MTKRKVVDHDNLRATDNMLKEKRNLKFGSIVLLSLMLRRRERSLIIIRREKIFFFHVKSDFIIKFIYRDEVK